MAGRDTGVLIGFYDSDTLTAHASTLVDRLAVAAIVVAAGARLMISFAPVAVFDIDPAIDCLPFVGATPAQSVLLDALAFAGASWLLVHRLLIAQVIGWGWIVLVALCIPAIALSFAHSMSDSEQLWHASTWVAGILVALAVLAQVGGDRSVFLRRFLVAALAGIAVVLAVRGIAQLTSEHSLTVEYYKANRGTFLKSQGWLENSSQALSYERRLMQNEATGWLGFANVFATVAAASAVLMANAALGRGMVVARSWLGLCAIMCAGLVVTSGSKGGVGALAVGLIVSICVRRWNGWSRWLLVALPLLAIAAVALRGLIGSNSAEQSLLFRWHYLVGGFGTFVSSPWTGVGPAGFQSAFMQTRPIESVEEVVSAHGAFADWMIAFGVAGIGIIALQLALAWWSAARTAAPNLARTGAMSGVVEIAVAAVVFASIISIAFESPALDDSIAYAWRLGGLAAGAITAWSIVRILERGGDEAERVVGLGLCAMAAVVLTHGQIDMVFWLPGSALWAWLVLAIAAWWNRGSSEPSVPLAQVQMSRLALGSMAALSFALAIGCALVISPSLAEQDEIAIDAAELLYESAHKNSSEALAIGRANAGLALAGAAKIWPPRTIYSLHAAEQLQAAAMCDPLPNEAIGWLRGARESAQSAEATRSGQFQSRLLLSTIAIREAELSVGSWQAAERALQDVLAINPRHCESWLRLADVFAGQGNTLAARAAFESALDCNESFALDPVRQFSADRKRVIDEKLSNLK